MQPHPPPGMPLGDPTAVVGKRFLSGLIDLAPIYVLMQVLSTVLQIGFLPGTFGSTGTTTTADETATGVALIGVLLVSYLVPLAAAFVNSVVLRSRNGASLGQQAVGLVTVTETGQRLSFGAATGRFFLGVVDGFPWCCYLPVVGMITIGTAKGHRRVADMVVRSYVVPKELAGTALGPPANLATTTGPWHQAVAPPSAGPTSDQPQWDPARGTWVRQDPTTGRWYRWDDPTGSWQPLDGA